MPLPFLSAAQARRIALAAQGFCDPRPGGRPDRRHLRRAMKRVGLLQIDSVPVVMRAQYMPLFSRLGPYAPGLLDRLAYRDDEWFEAWGHEASLLPVVDEPLLRWQKRRCRSGETWKGLVRFARAHPRYLRDILAQVRERPLTPAELRDPRPNSGEWWGARSDGAVALDWLWRIGEVGIRRRANFVKEFDLLERIVPARVRAQPAPSEPAALREWLRRAAAALGVAAADDLVDYHRLPKRPAKLQIQKLLAAGELTEARVEGWERPAYLHPAARRPRAVAACALLSPFDPVVWFRPRARRLFAFDYRIEIYTPAAKRVHGYYVLPFLLGDKIVARIDAKTDRAAGRLRVLAAFAEKNIPLRPTAARLADALDDLAQFVGAEEWSADGRKGDLMAPLAAAGRARR